MMKELEKVMIEDVEYAYDPEKEYIKDGHAYCKVCHERKDGKVMEFFGNKMLFRTSCKCDRDREAREKERQKKMEIERLKSSCFNLIIQWSYTFENYQGEENQNFIIGDEIKYKDKDYTITRFDDMGNNLKTVTVKDNTEYLGGMITDSDVIPYRLESDLERVFENLTYKKPETIAKESEIKKAEAHNFKITEETLPEKLSPSERLNNNLEAISMLSRIESRQRELDSTAQEVLARYVGWGGLADVFDEEKGGQWKEARSFLKENLSQAEYEAARESTLTSFYTPKTVIDGVYKTLSDMGFKSGNILEPSMGIGNFIGNLPDEMRRSKFYGVELDSIVIS